jgi:hypothetical protein
MAENVSNPDGSPRVDTSRRTVIKGVAGLAGGAAVSASLPSSSARADQRGPDGSHDNGPHEPHGLPHPNDSEADPE